MWQINRWDTNMLSRINWFGSQGRMSTMRTWKLTTFISLLHSGTRKACPFFIHKNRMKGQCRLMVVARRVMQTRYFSGLILARYGTLCSCGARGRLSVPVCSAGGQSQQVTLHQMDVCSLCDPELGACFHALDDDLGIQFSNDLYQLGQDAL